MDNQPEVVLVAVGSLDREGILLAVEGKGPVRVDAGERNPAEGIQPAAAADSPCTGCTDCSLMALEELGSPGLGSLGMEPAS